MTTKMHQFHFRPRWISRH